MSTRNIRNGVRGNLSPRWPLFRIGQFEDLDHNPSFNVVGLSYAF